jgi:hypothetical protein
MQRESERASKRKLKNTPSIGYIRTNTSLVINIHGNMETTLPGTNQVLQNYTKNNIYSSSPPHKLKFQVNSHGICGGYNGTMAFLKSTSVPPTNSHHSK